MKEKIVKLDSSKIENFYLAKDTVKRMKWLVWLRQKLYKMLSDKGFISKIYKGLKKTFKQSDLKMG